MGPPSFTRKFLYLKLVTEYYYSWLSFADNISTGSQGRIPTNVFTKVTSCAYCEEFYASARIYARFCYVSPLPPPHCGVGLRAYARPARRRPLLPSTRREVETNVSVSQTLCTFIRVRFVLIAFFILVISYQIVIFIFSYFSSVKNVTIR